MADEETQQAETQEAEAAPTEEAAATDAAATTTAESPADAAPAAEVNASPEALAEAEALAAALNGGIAADGGADGQASGGDVDDGPSIESLLTEAGAGGGVIDPLADLSDEARRILKIQVPVIVKLADKMLPMGDIVELTPGSIVEFARNAEQPLELMVNNKIIGRGVAVKVGEKFGLRIEEILPVEQKIRSLGA
ncbi:MAG: FliM/FliN family flagellar motor switch protein [Planctomycetes bacterium]|nr:FliM/FliN family flagellar motor switch protein [Planctomycetota bacterium]